MLEASNLGQIIGRARYGVLERRPQPELQEAAERARLTDAIRRAADAERARQQEAARLADNDATRHSVRSAPVNSPAPGQQYFAPPAPPHRPKATLGRGPGGRRRHAGSLVARIEALLAAHPQGVKLPAMASELNCAAREITKRLHFLRVEKLGTRRNYIYRLAP
jgi:hypothetical protein